MIQSVVPGPCRVTYSSVFGQETTLNSDVSETATGDNTGSTHPDSGETQRTQRKEQLHAIAEEIQSEYGFRASTANRSYDLELQTLLSEGTLPEFEIGYFRVPPDSEEFCFMPREKIVVWLAALNCGFSLICDPSENRMLAENVLKLLIKYIQDYCRVLSEPQNVLMKPDRVALIQNQFLPDGKLLFMNHRVIRQYEKELELKMKSQT